MKISAWALAVFDCLRERQFWHETVRETMGLVTGSSSGLGSALTAAVFAMGRRVVRAASAMDPLQAPSNLHNQAAQHNFLR